MFSKFRRQEIQNMSSTDVPYRRPSLPLIFLEIIIENDKNIIRRKITTVIVDDTDSVRVSVGCNPYVKTAVNHNLTERRHGFLIGSGKLTAEKRVMISVNRIDITSGCDENCLDGCLRHAIHGVQCDSQSRIPDCLHVDVRKNTVEILVDRINLPDQPCFFSILIRHSWYRKRFSRLLRFQFPAFDLCRIALDILRHLDISIPSALRKNLDTIIDGGVVTCRYHHSIGQPMFHRIKHGQRCRCRPIDQQRPDPVCRKNFRHPLHRLLGEESPVIADDHFLVIDMFRLHFVRHCGSEELKIVFREPVSDHCPPSACSKSNHLRLRSPVPVFVFYILVSAESESILRSQFLLRRKTIRKSNRKNSSARPVDSILALTTLARLHINSYYWHKSIFGFII